MSQFKFNILTGDDAQDKYDAIATKEPFTFYLLQTGVGYLGNLKLFDASLMGNVATLTTKFFRAVSAHAITEDDLVNDNISKPEGTAVGDTGLLFTADTDETDDGDEILYFVPVTVENINTIDLISETNPGDDVPTAAAVVEFVTRMLEDKVSFEIDGEVSTGDEGSGLTYSTKEKIVGTWIDGKPIYQATWTGETASKSNTWEEAGIQIENLDFLIDYDAIMVANISNAFLKMPYSESTNFVVINYHTGFSNLNGFCTYCNHVSGNYFYKAPFTVTARYTKTTD